MGNGSRSSILLFPTCTTASTITSKPNFSLATATAANFSSVPTTAATATTATATAATTGSDSASCSIRSLRWSADYYGEPAAPVYSHTPGTTTSYPAPASADDKHSGPSTWWNSDSPAD